MIQNTATCSPGLGRDSSILALSLDDLFSWSADTPVILLIASDKSFTYMVVVFRAVPRYFIKFSAYSLLGRFLFAIFKRKTGSVCFNLNELFFAYLISTYILLFISFQSSVTSIYSWTSSVFVNGTPTLFKSICEFMLSFSTKASSSITFIFCLHSAFKRSDSLCWFSKSSILIWTFPLNQIKRLSILVFVTHTLSYVFLLYAVHCLRCPHFFLLTNCGWLSYLTLSFLPQLRWIP